MSDQRKLSQYTPDAQHTICIRREPWSSPPVTVRTPNARPRVNAASALIWSVVGPTAAFLGCCVLGVRAPFRLVRVQRTSGYVQRSRITPSRCGLWLKGILYGAPAASSRSIRIPSVTGWIALDGIVGP